jgi:hypothetical protein
MRRFSFVSVGGANVLQILQSATGNLGPIGISL